MENGILLKILKSGFLNMSHIFAIPLYSFWQCFLSNDSVGKVFFITHPPLSPRTFILSIFKCHSFIETLCEFKSVMTTFFRNYVRGEQSSPGLNYLWPLTKEI